MVARKCEIYFECEQDISRVSVANKQKKIYKRKTKIYMESMYLYIIIRGF